MKLIDCLKFAMTGDEKFLPIFWDYRNLPQVDIAILANHSAIATNLLLKHIMRELYETN